MSQTSPRPDIAAVAWTDSSHVRHVRVYTQDMNGDIRESVKDGDSAWTVTRMPIARAKPNSSLAAFQHNDVASIHVFYLDTNNTLQEVCQARGDHKWSNGSLGESKIQAMASSRLAALAYDPNIWCTLFYQQPDGAIGHLNRLKDKQGRDREWDHLGSYGSNPMKGTGLAALSFKALVSHGVRVYYQQADGTVTDFGINNSPSFKPDSLRITSAPPNVNLSVFDTKHLDVRFHLFFFDKSNFVSEIGYFFNKWHDQTYPGLTRAAPDSGIAAVFFPENKSTKQTAKFYVQNETDQVVEYSSDNLLIWEKVGVVPT